MYTRYQIERLRKKKKNFLHTQVNDNDYIVKNMSPIKAWLGKNISIDKSTSPNKIARLGKKPKRIKEKHVFVY